MRQHDLDHLAATWSDVEAAAFETSLAGQRKVDPEVWGQLTPGHSNYTEERSDMSWTTLSRRFASSEATE